MGGCAGFRAWRIPWAARPRRSCKGSLSPCGLRLERERSVRLPGRMLREGVQRPSMLVAPRRHPPDAKRRNRDQFVSSPGFREEPSSSSGCTTLVACVLGAGRVPGVRLTRCGYQRGERGRPGQKRGPSVGTKGSPREDRDAGISRLVGAPPWRTSSEDLQGGEFPENNRATVLLCPSPLVSPKR